MKTQKKELIREQKDKLLATLQERFTNNIQIHEGMLWEDVLIHLKAHPEKLFSLHEMERTGGEPDVIAFNGKTGEYTFCDCCVESPIGRRSLCYDQAGLASRKNFKPESSAIDMAEEMGIELLDEEEYRVLQRLIRMDTKTSSWLKTPLTIRNLGGALFGDCRYDRVFIYHNGAQSYYGSRGFRGLLTV